MEFNIQKHEFYYDHSCSMLMLNNDLASCIKQWGITHISPDSLYTNIDNGIFGFEYSHHVTLLNYIKDETPHIIEPLIQSFKPITFTLDKISIFETFTFDVIKINVYSEHLHSLYNILSRTLIHNNRYDKFIPHITIAYVRKGHGKKFINDTTFDKLCCTVSELSFTSFTGMNYIIKLQGK